MSAQRPDSPLLRPSNPFERRAASAIAMAKPAISHGSLIARTLPGGTVLESARRTRVSGGGSTPVLPITIRRLAFDSGSTTGTFTVSPGLLSGQPVKANSETGDAISNLAPPEWEIVDGRLYLCIQFDPNFEDGYLEYHGGTPVGYVLHSGSVLSDDRSIGKFYYLLGEIADGVLVNDYSPRSNLFAMYGDSGAADSKMECALVRA